MVRIRKGREEDIGPIATLLVHSWQYCYRSFLPPSFLDHLSVEKQIERHRRIFDSGVHYLVVQDQRNWP